MRLRAAVFDFGETLLSEERAWGVWADWIGVTHQELFAAIGATVEGRYPHRHALELCRPGFDLRRAFAEGETGPTAVRALGIYMGRLRRTLILSKSGAGLQEAAKASGVFWKAEREFLRQARAWSLEHIEQLQPEVLDADRRCKTAGSPDTLIAERLFMTVAARAKRLGL